MHFELGWALIIVAIKELAELSRPMARMQLADDLAGRNIQRSKQRCSAVALVIVSPPLGLPRSHRQGGLGTIERLYLTLSSAHSTNARSGGLRYKPTMSRTFSINCGSVDSLKVSLRCGCRPNARQMR